MNEWINRVLQQFLLERHILLHWIAVWNARLLGFLSFLFNCFLKWNFPLETDHLPWPAGTALSNAPQVPLALLATRALQGHVHLVSPGPQVFFHRAAFQPVSPQPLCWCVGLPYPDAGLCIHLCWIADRSPVPIPSTCPGPSKGLHSSQGDQPKVSHSFVLLNLLRRHLDLSQVTEE